MQLVWVFIKNYLRKTMCILDVRMMTRSGLILSHIPILVVVVQNNMLYIISNWEEVQQAIKNLDPNNALGPNGFACHFFEVA